MGWLRGISECEEETFYEMKSYERRCNKKEMTVEKKHKR